MRQIVYLVLMLELLSCSSESDKSIIDVYEYKSYISNSSCSFFKSEHLKKDSNIKFNVSVLYPDGFLEIPIKQDDDVALGLVYEKKDSTIYMFVKVTAENRDDLPYLPIAWGTTIIKSDSAKWMIEEFPPNTNQFNKRIISYTVFKNNLYYCLIFAAPKNHFDDYLCTFNKIAKTFTIGNLYN